MPHLSLLKFEFDKNYLLDRLMRRRTITESGCWLFNGPNSTNKREIYISDKNYLVARVSAYIHKGLNLDNPNILVCHECREENCWNPEHIYLGNTSTNTLDSVRDGTFKNPNTGKTHCKHGHPLTGNNLYLHLDLQGNTHRWCKTCRSNVATRHRVRRKVKL